MSGSHRQLASRAARPSVHACKEEWPTSDAYETADFARASDSSQRLRSKALDAIRAVAWPQMTYKSDRTPGRRVRSASSSALLRTRLAAVNISSAGRFAARAISRDSRQSELSDSGSNVVAS